MIHHCDTPLNATQSGHVCHHLPCESNGIVWPHHHLCTITPFLFSCTKHGAVCAVWSHHAFCTHSLCGLFLVHSSPPSSSFTKHFFVLFQQCLQLPVLFIIKVWCIVCCHCCHLVHFALLLSILSWYCKHVFVGGHVFCSMNGRTEVCVCG